MAIMASGSRKPVRTLAPLPYRVQSVPLCSKPVAWPWRTDLEANKDPAPCVLLPDKSQLELEEGDLWENTGARGSL